MGSRGKNPGQLFKSIDFGKTWVNTGKVTDDEITCLASGGNGIAYLLTGKANFYRSEDEGTTWTFLAKISENSKFGPYTLSYGIMVTDQGTLLVSDTAPSGGHIYRSADKGAHWTDLGPISEHALYRFERTQTGILVNGWEGGVYKSRDDGLTWQRMQHLTDGALFATEYLGQGVALQASESGRIFRSKDEGETWTDLGKLTEATDDFVKLGDGKVLLTTYKEGKNMYLSEDNGATWMNIGALNPEIKEDWLDHVIWVDSPDGLVLVGGSNQGFAIRAITGGLKGK